MSIVDRVEDCLRTESESGQVYDNGIAYCGFGSKADFCKYNAYSRKHNAYFCRFHTNFFDNCGGKNEKFREYLIIIDEKEVK